MKGMRTAFIFFIVVIAGVYATEPATAGSSCDTPVNMFAGHLEPAPVGGAFKMKEYIVWGGSVTKGDDGRYYMFASRWPKSVGMRNWVVNSEVVLA